MALVKIVTAPIRLLYSLLLLLIVLPLGWVFIQFRARM
jgi:hypothetical protein